MMAITGRLNGEWRADKEPPFGERLRCPMCRKTRRAKIVLGRKAPVVFCIDCKAKGDPLTKAVTKATGISLAPKQRPLPPQKALNRMRRSDAYEGLPLRSNSLSAEILNHVSRS